ncbi:MAG TPA: cation:proton antiporter [Anaerolineales bacterium]|nr:cation:proton antiporter [Anaerolineales bacterium]
MYTAHNPAAAAAGEMLPLLFALAVLIASAKLSGALSRRLGQPAVLGELLAGLVLGPTFLNLLSLPMAQASGLRESIHSLGQLGVLWLMFSAGMEIELADFRRAGRPAVWAGMVGVAAPVAVGAGLGLGFHYSWEESLSLGLVLSATSVSISAQTLMELGALKSRVGTALLGAAVVDDILVIILLSVLVAVVSEGGSLIGLPGQLGTMVLVLVVISAISFWALPHWAEWGRRLKVSQGMLALVLAGVLFIAWATEYFGGMAAITGAFLAGIGLGRSHLREEIEGGLERIGYGFFVPLFLLDIGLQSNLRSLNAEGALFGGLLLLAAAVSKVAGSGLGARAGGFSWRESLQMGTGMISRGEVGLIVAGVGVAEGLLEPGLFANVVLMVIGTTLITPPALRWAFTLGGNGDASSR